MRTSRNLSCREPEDASRAGHGNAMNALLQKNDFHGDSCSASKTLRLCPRPCDSDDMWDSFWPDVVVALIGAVFTVIIAYVTYRVNASRQERAAVQSLIDELHYRRALRPNSGRIIPSASTAVDFASVSASVRTMRVDIRSARDRARQDESVQRPLARMTKACNRFLTESRLDPSRYQILLGELTDELAKQVRELKKIQPQLTARQPGGGSD